MDDIYSRLRSENKDKYGTRIGVIAQFIIASLYSSRTHFLFELLQNTEDACDRAKRQGRLGPFYARFELFEDKLVLRHNGIPFEEDDVRGICGLVEGTKEKDPGQIGKFGIGFKSVYAFTTSPEIYSAGWSIKIENYVYPIELPKMQIEENETVIIIHFNSYN